MIFNPSSPYPNEAELRQRRFDFCPWFFPHESTPQEQADQAAYQKLLHKLYGTTVGDNVYISPLASITGRNPDLIFRMGKEGFVAAGCYITDDVELGDFCTLNPHAILRGKIQIGNGVRIGAYACMVGFNHGFARTDVPIYTQPHTAKGITLGDDIWVGSHVTIVDGVTVGSHSILAGGAVVTKDVPDFAIVGGNPARVIRMRTPAETAQPGVPPEVR